MGRSGGTLILAGNGWVVHPIDMPLVLEAPRVNWAYGKVESRSTGEVIRCLAYYGHPLDRPRTLRDMHVIDELETTDAAPLVVMGDMNIDDSYCEMHLSRLGDAGSRWAFQRGAELEPTFVNNGVSTRIDRVWVSYSLLQSLLLFSVEDTFLVPGHRAVWTYYEARSDAIWTSHAAPPIDVQGIQKDPLWERRLEEMWSDYVSQPHSVADMYIRWSTMWEQYLREVTSSPGELTRHKPAKITQDRIGGVSQSLSHAVRRLQNFVAKLRKLQNFVHKGVHHFGLWRSVKTSSVYFSARYGAPVLSLHQMDELTCVAQVLKATEEHYEKFLEQELSKVSQNRRMAFRQRLHENQGVNKTMSAMLQARSTTELEIEHEGKRTVRYQDILDELMRSWKYLYDGEPALADGGWKDTYLNYPKREEFPLKPLEAGDLRAALKSAKKTSTPGPDGWRYSELPRGPKE